MNAIQLDRPCLKLQPTEKPTLIKIALITLGISVCVAASGYPVYHYVERNLFYAYTAASSFLVIAATVRFIKLIAHQEKIVKIAGYSGFKKTRETHKKPEQKKPVVKVLQPNGKMDALPDDMLFLILQKLNMPSLAKVAQTSKCFRNLLEGDVFWKNKLIQDFSHTGIKENEAKKRYRLLYGYKERIYQEFCLDVSKWNTVECNNLGNNLIFRQEQIANFRKTFSILTPNGSLSFDSFSSCWQKNSANFFFAGSDKKILVFNSTFEKITELDFPEKANMPALLLNDFAFYTERVFETDHAFIAFGSETVLAFDKKNGKFQEALQIGKVWQVQAVNQKLYALSFESKKIFMIEKPSADSGFRYTPLFDFQHIKVDHYGIHEKQEAVFYKADQWCIESLNDFKSIDTLFFDRFASILDKEMQKGLTRDKAKFCWEIGIGTVTRTDLYENYGSIYVFDANSCLWETVIPLPKRISSISCTLLPDGKLAAYIHRHQHYENITELRIFDFGKFIE